MSEAKILTPLHETAQLADEALRLVKECRYGELLSHAEKMERQTETLERLHGDFAGGAPLPATVAAECRQVQRRIAVLAEVLRHTAMVDYALREIEMALTCSYSQAGQLQPASETHLNAEA